MKPLLLKIHVNPPAEVSTSLKVYQGHTLEKTYMGEDFFWAITPNAGDYILFKFDKPVNVERLVPIGVYLILEFRPLPHGTICGRMFFVPNRCEETVGHKCWVINNM